jgi:hypothetical protein
MLEVRIRHEMDATSSHLADISFKDVDEILPTLKSWGVEPAVNHGLSGQFVVDAEDERFGPRAYFEVIIHSDD